MLEQIYQKKTKEMNMSPSDIQGLCIFSDDCCQDVQQVCKSDDLCGKDTCGEVLINNKSRRERASASSFFLVATDVDLFIDSK